MLQPSGLWWPELSRDGLNNGKISTIRSGGFLGVIAMVVALRYHAICMYFNVLLPPDLSIDFLPFPI